MPIGLLHWLVRFVASTVVSSWLTLFSGPSIGFAGCLVTKIPHIELLTPLYHLNTNYDETDMALQLARAFGAFRSALQSLQSHYANLRQRETGKDRDGDVRMVSSMPHEILHYPYRRHYRNHNGVPVEFEYIR